MSQPANRHHLDVDERHEHRRRHREQRQGAGELEQLVAHFDAVRHEMRAWRDEMVTINGIRRRGAIAKPIPPGPTGAAVTPSIKLASSAGRLAGIGFRELAGAAAVLRLRDGVDAGGDLLLPVSLLANESRDVWWLPEGISYGAGVYLEIVSGLVEGAVFFVAGSP